jgi:hypothetical protein
LYDDGDGYIDYYEGAVATYDGTDWTIIWQQDMPESSTKYDLPTFFDPVTKLDDGELVVTITSKGWNSTNNRDFYFDKAVLTVNTEVNPVPVPGAVLLGILGLSAAGVKLRKFA